MRRLNSMAEEYVAPELEVGSTVVEAGFTVSNETNDFEDLGDDIYGDF